MAARSRTGRTLLAVIVGAAVVGCASATALVAPARAAGADAPTCSSGVIVAVDFSPWDGPVNTVCDLVLPQTAAYALEVSGFDPVGVASYGLAFICQIAGDPPDDSCQSTPPASAYWSFWIAEAGANSWTYSNEGAMSLEPQAGSVEAWVFGDETASSQPDIPSPNAIRASTTDTTTATLGSGQGQPPPATTPTSPAAGGGGSATPPDPTSAQGNTSSAVSTGSSGSSGSSTPESSPSPADTPGGSSIHTSGGGFQAGSPTSKPQVGPPHGKPAGASGSSQPKAETSSTPRIVSAAPVLAHQSSGTPVGAVIGAVAVIALAGAAGFLARRRRRGAG